MQATKAIIYLNNLRQNIQTVRHRVGPHPKICFPVKADGYGHGAVDISRYALEAGVEYLAVTSVAEGNELRLGGINAPVLLLAQTQPDELADIMSLDLIPLVSDGEYIEKAASAAKLAGKKLCLHLKINTGMGRLGCRPEDAVDLAVKIASDKNLIFGGVATHLSVSDSLDPEDIAYTKGQLCRFREAVAAIREAGLEPPIVHAANSGGVAFHEDSFFDMVRPGIFLYGYMHGFSNPPLSPVMELRSAVVYIHKVKKGEAVSYGRTWVAPEDTNIGVIPLGYSEGIPRLLSNNHSLSIRGKSYPLVGRICMNLCHVNLGKDTEVQRWDEAVIFGPEFITAADIAGKCNTIAYEITCNIKRQVPRVYQA